MTKLEVSAVCASPDGSCGSQHLLGTFELNPDTLIFTQVEPGPLYTSDLPVACKGCGTPVLSISLIWLDDDAAKWLRTEANAQEREIFQTLRGMSRTDKISVVKGIRT
jgi:hypothetical protein